jgi:transcriptional regulator with XRE-family HTH domain
MLTDTLTNELERYRIGPRIKSLRQGKNMGLVQLAAHTGLSTAMLSKIERGQLFPTLPTLLRVALVFGVDLDHFFSLEGPRVAVTRKDERVRLPAVPADKAPAYLFESLNFPISNRRFDAYLAIFPAGAKPSECHRHGSEEFIFVMKGRIGVAVDGQLTSLTDGDAMYFDSTVPHSYSADDRDTSSAVVITIA